ncbi:MAG: phosphoribosylformylglycinamidine cyclo-ligase [Sphingomonadaceae bacterium]|uniref:phosphoribosylformylglycinamidine cyclo-ligase n=1 Tax=Thermaurantiacus sp. TaxID=2820283 RepID=UPI00298F115D|nr:phosphoribosylformylglycinamidine cyclo-ligase [Thermaurantiacus sp.]MCS6986952.1 phosphoribosylformylglycinamidine cyclo-ligase [Sphingomonadaceae bacterium]MDW8415448.1 phosphoribosylformylglycinamidine cyclo-ligase [Thermaurantiacus sp.]
MHDAPSRRPATYAEAGVSIAAGNALVRAIAPLARATQRAGADAGLGGFGAFLDPRAAGYRDPLVVATTDGVGTKLRLAIDSGRVAGIGQDLVAMCVNDLIVTGAEPIAFLDYFACGRLNLEVAREVVAGIARACTEAGCALVGGETAEMPGFYPASDFDLAGFAIGLVERDRVLGPQRVRPGDVVLGLASSGLHANGFSLVRRLVEGLRLDAPAPFDPSRPLLHHLLEPTRLYVRALLPQVPAGGLHALAHVTGGGLLENVPRVLPHGCRVRVEGGRWPVPPVFTWLQALGGIAPAEMLRTFNCGLGMVAIAAPEAASAVARALRDTGERVFEIGQVDPGPWGIEVALPSGVLGASAAMTIGQDG